MVEDLVFTMSLAHVVQIPAASFNHDPYDLCHETAPLRSGKFTFNS